MEKAGNFNRAEVPEGVSMRIFEDDGGRNRGVNLDSEILIRKAFESSINQGIELLFRYYYRPLCSHAVRFVSSKEVAEDIVSDIFFKFHSEQIFRDVKTSFRAYLFTSVRHRAFDYVSMELKRTASMQVAEFVAIKPDQQPDQITQYEDLYQDVENAVNSLPFKRRRIFIMHRFEGKKHLEIAEELNLSLRTVEAQMFQATHQIRAMIRDKWFVLILAFLQ